MKSIKRWSVIFLVTLLTVTGLTGCTSHKKKTVYQNYVQDLMDVNYKGIYDGYVENEGGNESDAITMYNESCAALANQLIAHYSMTGSATLNVSQAYIELAKNIYAQADYTVSESYEKDGTYYVDVTIYPLDILNQSYDEVLDYIDDFNEAVAAGKYNDYTESEYEEKFALGIADILSENCSHMEYRDAVTVTVAITDDGEYYYIDTEGLQTINDAMIALEGSGDTATSNDAEQTDATTENDTEQTDATENASQDTP